METLPLPPLVYAAHAFGQRYELPLPLWLFVGGGALIVLASFVLVLKRSNAKKTPLRRGCDDTTQLLKFNRYFSAASYAGLLLLALAGITGSQETAENILPTVFWVLAWIAVPLLCGLAGDWTQRLNPFCAISRQTDNRRLRQFVLGRSQPLAWPQRLGWWPAAAAYFILASGELIFNTTATRPAVIGTGLLAYFALSAFMGLLFGRVWSQKGEVFTILYATWGKLGYWRFGSDGRKGFGRGLVSNFEPVSSRIIFVLLLLVSVSFDGLLSTPAWNSLQHQLPGSVEPGSLGFKLMITVSFAALAGLVWALFAGFSQAAVRAGRLKSDWKLTMSHLLPSLLPISFGYLLAHNLEYLLINGQLMLPLLGNPVGKENWPLRLPNPFNDSYEIHLHPLPSAFYWYSAAAVIVAVHILAVILAHRHLTNLARSKRLANRSEYPWIIVMVAYTMLSLWLLAQPLVSEKSHEEASGSGTYISLITYRN